MNTKEIKGVHVLLVTNDGKIILQEKTQDYIPNPGRISMFGGGTEINEKELDVLRRELMEELALDIDESKFKKLDTYFKNKELDGVEYGISVYVVYGIESDNMILNEGKNFIIDKPEILLQNEKITRMTKLALYDFLNHR